MAREVRQIAARYGQEYNTGRMSRQIATVFRRIWVYRKPQAV